MDALFPAMDSAGPNYPSTSSYRAPSFRDHSTSRASSVTGTDSDFFRRDRLNSERASSLTSFANESDVRSVRSYANSDTMSVQDAIGVFSDELARKIAMRDVQRPLPAATDHLVGNSVGTPPSATTVSQASTKSWKLSFSSVVFVVVLLVVINLLLYAATNRERSVPSPEHRESMASFYRLGSSMQSISRG